MMAEDKTDKEQELEDAEEAAHEKTVEAARNSLEGTGGPLVSEAVAADPVAANSEPYKSLLKSQREDGVVEAKDKDESEALSEDTSGDKS
jgi:hypothetical protein